MFALSVSNNVFALSVSNACDLFSGKVIKVDMSRMLLCEATARIMEAGFSILGIRTLDKM